MIVVSDNSALSCLAELGELDLLRKLYGTIAITTSVVEQVKKQYRARLAADSD